MILQSRNAESLATFRMWYCYIQSSDCRKAIIGRMWFLCGDCEPIKYNNKTVLSDTNQYIKVPCIGVKLFYNRNFNIPIKKFVKFLDELTAAAFLAAVMNWFCGSTPMCGWPPIYTSCCSVGLGTPFTLTPW